jgi:hypothetical protein
MGKEISTLIPSYIDPILLDKSRSEYVFDKSTMMTRKKTKEEIEKDQRQFKIQERKNRIAEKKREKEEMDLIYKGLMKKKTEKGKKKYLKELIDNIRADQDDSYWFD